MLAEAQAVLTSWLTLRPLPAIVAVSAPDVTSPPVLAGIDALKRAGCTDILSLSAVGSLKEEHKPLDFVIPDQFVDRTRHRVDTFFGDGLVVHVALGEPICGEMAGRPLEAFALVALGFDRLSMPPAGIGPVKQMVLSLDREAARRGVEALIRGTSGSVRNEIETLARKLYVAV